MLSVLLAACLTQTLRAFALQEEARFEAVGCSMVGSALLGVLLLMCLGVSARADVGVTNGLYWVDSADLKMTVTPSSGTMKVDDKANGLTWYQRSDSSHSAYSNVTLFTNSNCIGFNTSFYLTGGGTLFTWVELWLSAR